MVALRSTSTNRLLLLTALIISNLALLGLRQRRPMTLLTARRLAIPRRGISSRKRTAHKVSDTTANASPITTGTDAMTTLFMKAMQGMTCLVMAAISTAALTDLCLLPSPWPSATAVLDACLEILSANGLSTGQVPQSTGAVYGVSISS
ncbi:hypothetical protein LTR01_008857, partial [Friedmanniomyces endolithicus]